MSSKVTPTDETPTTDKQQYRILNWPKYNRALEHRGNITFLFSEQVIEDWYSQAVAQQGAQEKYRANASKL